MKILGEEDGENPGGYMQLQLRGRHTRSNHFFPSSLPVVSPFVFAFLFGVGSLSAAQLYVDSNNAFPESPFDSWTTAARTIQEAVDAALPGDEVVVTNGVYASGGRAVEGMMTNRVAVTKPILLRSMNGPDFTFIRGYQLPGQLNGDGAIRCVYLANGACLSGFTLTNGATRTYKNTAPPEHNGGGVFCESTATVTNCVFLGNTSGFYGGGAYSGRITHCLFKNNSSLFGGGAAAAVLFNCRLLHNSAEQWGGGAGFFSTLNNCALNSNSANWGGAAQQSILNNCTVTGNEAEWAGGVVDCTLTNSIVYFNRALRDPNHFRSTFNYSCTTPDPGGIDNLTADPELASDSCLSPVSTCIQAGDALFARGVDIDDEPWLNPPSIGCDEYYPGSASGPLTVSIQASSTNPAINTAVSLTAMIQGRASTSVWDFGDGTVISNQPFATHTWTAAGEYTASVLVLNGDHPQGVSAELKIRVVAGLHYVAANSSNPVAPYTTWATAARNIQDAVDVADSPGSVVLVSNGVYKSGGKTIAAAIGNRVAVQKPISIRSVNGPGVTLIQGIDQEAGLSRCVYLSGGASLIGFTLTNGIADAGGGVVCESIADVVSNCLVVANAALASGGGAYGGTFYNCTFRENQESEIVYGADQGGAGTYGSRLVNCVLENNSGRHGGAAGGQLVNCVLTGNSDCGAFAANLYNCTVVQNPDVGTSECNVYNSIVYFNGPTGNENHISCPMFYCCTTPLTTFMDSIGNIDVSPDFAGLTDYRLVAGSSCINTGENTYVKSLLDMDGHPRIVGGIVDMGAYEFATEPQLQFIAWLQRYQLPTDGSADYADTDGDEHTNWQEWVCGTIPTNRLSVLRMLSLNAGATGARIDWEGVVGRTYFVDRATNSGPPIFHTLTSGISGEAGTNTFVDVESFGNTPILYRVGVRSQ